MEETINTISSTLLSRARANDGRAWEQLVDMYGPLVYRWCLAKGLLPQQAEDVGQEVFLAVARNLATYKNESFHGWLRTIAERKIIDFWKQQAGQPVAGGGTDGQRQMNEVPAKSEYGQHADELELRSALLELIRSQFSEQDVQAFCRLTLGDRTPAEVAEELGISRNKVYLAKSRILRWIRDHSEKGVN